jgi:hypothetical protein
VTERLQTGVHPDADQISLFLEGVATEPERVQMFEHLAGCASCREMVFLGQGIEAPPVATAEEPRRAPWWRRGWMPFGLAGAALAFALALVMYLRQPAAPVGDRQVAGLQAPPPTPVTAPGAPAAEEKKPQPSAPENRASRPSTPLRKTAPAVGAGSDGGIGAGVYQAPSPSPSVIANDQAMEVARGNMARLTQKTATAAPAPAPPAAAALSPASAPVALGANPISQLQAQGGPTLKGRNFAALGVLHDQATTDGLSEVSGVVTDTTGAAINGASVTLSGAVDKAVREVATGPDGRFRMVDLPAGKYELRVSAQGFNTMEEQVELKPRDVAMLDSALNVSAASETVTVAANSAPIQTTSVESAAANVVAPANLPDGAAGAAQVAMGERVLKVDAAGNLYLSRNAGKSWKKVKPKWAGKAAQLGVAPLGTGRQVFELTTDAGAVWTSEDGKHWRPRADGKQ